MSTLPFLLSVADELDNLNSQNYLDDFGLGFHPHRQYYRTPTIQLSLPASTEWMEQEQSRHHSRYRSTFRYYGEPQNNLQSPTEGDEEDNDEQESSAAHDKDSAAAASTTSAQKYVSALNSNTDKDDILDNSLQMYNISKKCSKDYYRHSEPGTSSASTLSTALSASTSKPPPLPPRMSTAATAAAAAAKNKDNKPNMSYRLHSKCLEGTNSSSEESLQKVTSSIEFLTCFLLKKTRISKNDSGADGKKS